jgi:hypothetical protein
MRRPALGARGDRYEAEANRFADDVARGDRAGALLPRAGSSQPLDGATLREFELRLGLDLGRVRVHADHEAETAASGLRARAFTVGQDIFVRPGALAAPGGARLIAHELAHVAQQRRDARAPAIQCDGETEEERQRETNHAIMQMTDPELFKVLATMDPRLQKAFVSGATGDFAKRAGKMIERYNMDGVELSDKTRSIGQISQYSKGGKANYLDILGSKRRADELEHLRSTAAAKVLVEDRTNKWKRDSPTIVLAEAHSRLKTPMDNKLTKDLKDGKITADDWLKHSGTNAYRSWFEARAQGVPVPSAEEFARAVLAQERELKKRYYQKLLTRLDQIQAKAEADAANVGRVQDMLTPRADFMGAQETNLERTAVGLDLFGTGILGQTIVSMLDPAEAPAEVAEITEVAEAAQVAETASTVSTGARVGTGVRVAVPAATTGIRVSTSSGVRVISIQALRTEAAARVEAIAEEEALGEAELQTTTVVR